MSEENDKWKTILYEPEDYPPKSPTNGPGNHFTVEGESPRVVRLDCWYSNDGPKSFFMSPEFARRLAAELVHWATIASVWSELDDFEKDLKEGKPCADQSTR